MGSLAGGKGWHFWQAYDEGGPLPANNALKPRDRLELSSCPFGYHCHWRARTHSHPRKRQ